MPATDFLDHTVERLNKQGSKLRGIAVPWFTAESWPRLLAIAADRDTLPATFEAFVERAGERFDRDVANGLPLEKVLIDPEALGSWCADLGRSCDGRARAMFAVVMLMQRDQLAGNA
jgi:hypothetical protein